MKIIDLPYELKNVEVDLLTLPRAAEFAKAVLRHRYTVFKECKVGEQGDEFVYFSVFPELSQVGLNEIKYEELIAVQFTRDDNLTPWVYALRDDFPYLLHLNGREFEKPRCLCLLETPFEELKRSWTGHWFIERIRQWLSDAYQNEVHHEDQPLEPFILSVAGNLVLPSQANKGADIFVYPVGPNLKQLTFLGYEEAIPGFNGEQVEVLQVETKAIKHDAVIKSIPNLWQLHQLLVGLEENLVGNLLVPHLHNLRLNRNSEYWNRKLLIVLSVPRYRNNQSEETVMDTTAFITSDKTIKEVALSTNAYVNLAEVLTPVEEGSLSEQKIESVKLIPLKVYERVGVQTARKYSGTSSEEADMPLSIIGAGALGSQVFMNLAKAGFSRMVVLDKDVLLPHNIVRHALSTRFIGLSKAQCIAHFAHNELCQTGEFESIHDDYLNLTDEVQFIDKFEDRKAVIDMSASVAVARKISEDSRLGSRRMSVFLNPRGTDLVVLLEPSDRSIKLTELEMQYYRLTATKPALSSHLAESEQSVRYSGSCSDISSTIEQANVGLLSGLAAKLIPTYLSSEGGRISVYKSGYDGTVELIEETPFATENFKGDTWEVIIDESLLGKIRALRECKTPNETGGILLGVHDFESKTTYVVDALNSPDDSEEMEYGFLRGLVGVGEAIEIVQKLTAGNVSYIGEWHSHPDGAGVQRSAQDLIQYDWIKDHLEDLGKPPLMIIVGDKDIAVYTE